MSNPWHGEIAALSPPHLIRDNTVGWWGVAGGRGGGGATAAVAGGGGEVEEKGEWEERQKTGRYEREVVAVRL